MESAHLYSDVDCDGLEILQMEWRLPGAPHHQLANGGPLAIRPALVSFATSRVSGDLGRLAALRLALAHGVILVRLAVYRPYRPHATLQALRHIMGRKYAMPKA